MVIELPVLPPPVDELWHALLELGDRLDVPWALIGGQMVLLHALEHGQEPPQISQDGDVIADIRAVPGALKHLVADLERMGFALQSISTDGLAHRYTRPAVPRPVVIDVLAPEGLGERADLTTTPPGRTIEVPGGTQALGRAEHVTVVHQGHRGAIPRPTLLAAIVGKAAATALPGPDRHYRDLALLCALVPDPFELVEQLTRKDRQRMRRASKLLDDSHPAWALVPDAIRSAGQIAYGVLHG
ncbi:hypothetical protein [Aeromicrobium fastidiosum]|uniref:Nucleotidyl transferase AbiEii/AbiGii toxin family protein n=1 Tax=Aeromicrobium fastidiosum TaxID=52699 RepID=A0A641ALY6_9ACTN|nr:hypothetical protein [Aeromicrobium fastidiosum]KAA1375934.1 hypothetical protein ESP62_010735 [Aeromicrobium fastidiosum]MBP2392210.1 hypothetical protein [Aeromicrobium fastidiosum]